MNLFILSKENLDLSIFEIISLGKITKYETVENLLITDKKISYKQLAYTKKAYEVFFECDSFEKFKTKLDKIELTQHYKKSFCFRKTTIARPGKIAKKEKNELGKDFPSENKLADLVYERLKRSVKPVVDLKNPQTKFSLIITGSRAFFCTEIWENNELFSSRKAHLRPKPHPTSLDPRLARALVNILNKDFIDPFCGSGGFLIEGGLRGLKVEGYDIDPNMIIRAKLNLQHYKIKDFNLFIGDGLRIKKKVPAILTDLPYGRNSKIKDLTKTYKTFLTNAKNITKKMVVAFPDFVDSDDLIKKAGWKIIADFDYYLHKSLSKKIYVLEN